VALPAIELDVEGDAAVLDVVAERPLQVELPSLRSHRLIDTTFLSRWARRVTASFIFRISSSVR
jgi:hypothetical protein